MRGGQISVFGSPNPMPGLAAYGVMGLRRHEPAGRRPPPGWYGVVGKPAPTSVVRLLDEPTITALGGIAK
ncbi:hypothetical protein [Streptomyces olivaceoviridis]|uniref:hypothetical protein n=1 Tax=Streptomyces olivaceoviridis TaxID=1921 RepID=UPI00368A55AF